MGAQMIASAALLLIFIALRKFSASTQSLSSSLFTTMLLSPIAVHASTAIEEQILGRGSGLYVVFAMSVSVGFSFAGLVGLTLNGLACLLKYAKSQDLTENSRLRTLLRGIAATLLLVGAVLAYLIWPTEGIEVATGIFLAMRVVVSLAVVAWFMYLSYLLWL